MSILLALALAGSVPLEQVCGPSTRVMFEQGSLDEKLARFERRLKESLATVPESEREWYRDHCVSYLIGAREALRQLPGSSQR